LTRLSQIEVEPLSEQRWSKVERSLLSRVALEGGSAPEHSLGSRRRVGARVGLLAAAAVGALLVAVFTLRAFPERALIQQPSRITTGLSGSHLALPGWSIDVEPQSAVVVGAETPQGVLVVLDRGSIVCDVLERPKEAPLLIQAGAARVRVLGTRFSVTRMGELARVAVQQGVVEVSARGQSWKVRAGEQWPAEVPQPAPVQAVMEPSAVPSSVPEPAPASAERRVSSPARARVASASVATPEVTAADPQPRAPGPQTVFEQATAMERTDPARASELYRTLEAGSDSWAQNALYARGRLEASRGNHAEARRLLGRYLERFPRGSNAEDARSVLKRLR
jgi:hypothetical protein